MSLTSSRNSRNRISKMEDLEDRRMLAGSGDFNDNDSLDVDDLDVLTAEVRSRTDDERFDLTGDGVVDQLDRDFWVRNLYGTCYGDANLDRSFDSSDLVLVFTAGKYQTDAEALWAEGDWDGDGVFNESDFVRAFEAPCFDLPIPLLTFGGSRDIPEGETGRDLYIEVSDPDLDLAVVSTSNEHVFPTQGITISSTGTRRMLTVSPSQSAKAGQTGCITLSATTKEGLEVFKTATLEVTRPNDVLEPTAAATPYSLGIVGRISLSNLVILGEETDAFTFTVASNSAPLQVILKANRLDQIGDISLVGPTGDVKSSQIDNVVVFEVDSPEIGKEYRLIITGEEESEVQYSMSITGANSDVLDSDVPIEIETSSISHGVISENDIDEYLLTADSDGFLRLFLEADIQFGDADLTVAPADNPTVILDASSTSSSNELISLPVFAGERFLVSVNSFGGSRQFPYRLLSNRVSFEAEVIAVQGSELTSFRTSDATFVSAEAIDATPNSDVEIGPAGLIYVSSGAGIDEYFFNKKPTGARYVIPDGFEQEAEIRGFSVLDDGSFLIAQPDLGKVIRLSRDGNVEQEFFVEAGQTDVAVTRFGDLVTGASYLAPRADGQYWQTAGSGVELIGNSGLTTAFAIPEAFDVHESSDRALFVSTSSGLFYRKEGEPGFTMLIAGDTRGIAVSHDGNKAAVPEGPSDRDGDGIPDKYEIDGGIEVNGTPGIQPGQDVVFEGADPDHMDLYVEVDAMRIDATRSYTPLPFSTLGNENGVDIPQGLLTNTVLDPVVESFANAPVYNPNGKSGIRLHLQIDPADQMLPQNRLASDASDTWDAVKGFRNQFFGTHLEREMEREGEPSVSTGVSIAGEKIAKGSVRDIKGSYYRYLLFGHSIGDLSIVGTAERPGRNAIVTLGQTRLFDADSHGLPQDERERRLAHLQAAVSFHELGHSLGLGHGDGDNINLKENFSSIMNYACLDLSGSTPGILDFASGQGVNCTGASVHAPVFYEAWRHEVMLPLANVRGTGDGPSVGHGDAQGMPIDSSSGREISNPADSAIDGLDPDELLDGPRGHIDWYFFDETWPGIILARVVDSSTGMPLAADPMANEDPVKLHYDANLGVPPVVGLDGAFQFGLQPGMKRYVSIKTDTEYHASFEFTRADAVTWKESSSGEWFGDNWSVEGGPVADSDVVLPAFGTSVTINLKRYQIGAIDPVASSLIVEGEYEFDNGSVSASTVFVSETGSLVLSPTSALHSKIPGSFLAKTGNGGMELERAELGALQIVDGIVATSGDAIISGAAITGSPPSNVALVVETDGVAHLADSDSLTVRGAVEVNGQIRIDIKAHGENDFQSSRLDIRTPSPQSANTKLIIGAKSRLNLTISGGSETTPGRYEVAVMTIAADDLASVDVELLERQVDTSQGLLKVGRLDQTKKLDNGILVTGKTQIDRCVPGRHKNITAINPMENLCVWTEIVRLAPGDADGNGVFDSADLVEVFKGRPSDNASDEYIKLFENSEWDDVLWREGDWNGDHRFDSADFVAAFQYGAYEGDSVLTQGLARASTVSSGTTRLDAHDDALAETTPIRRKTLDNIFGSGKQKTLATEPTVAWVP